MIRTFGGCIRHRPYLSRCNLLYQDSTTAPLSGMRRRHVVVVRCSNNSSDGSNRETTKVGGSSNVTQTPQSSSSSLSSSTNTTTVISSLKSFAIGSFAGLLGSLAGMGGGFVMIPLMTSKYVYSPQQPLTQHQAHGTSLFAVAATGLAGAVSYYTASRNVESNADSTGDESGKIDTTVVRIPEAAAIAFTAIITARWGAQATLFMSGTTLKRSLGYLMLCMAPAVPAKAYYLQSIDETSTKSISDGDISMWNRLIYPTFIGIGSGFLSGLFGVGGGTIVVPALTLLTDLTHHEALGTSLAAMILPALSGTYTHYQAGNCVLRVAPFLATGALVGAYVGAQLSLRTDESTLRFGFAALLAVLGVRTLMKT